MPIPTDWLKKFTFNPMDKSSLRKAYLEKRRNLSPEEFTSLSGKIAQHLLSFLQNYSCVHLFLPIAKFAEFDTFFLLNQSSLSHIKWICSKVDGSDLQHYTVDASTQLKEDKWGIPSPVNANPADIFEVEVVLCPLLSYDLQGNRLGYGKGYYDKFLSELKQPFISCGISFFPPQTELLQAEAHDIPLNMVVNPEGILKFGTNE